MYKILKLNKEEIKTLRILLAQAILDLKTSKQDNMNEYDEIYYTNTIAKYQKLLNIISYIER